MRWIEDRRLVGDMLGIGSGLVYTDDYEAFEES